MRIYKTKPFAKWCKKSRLDDSNLIEAVDEIEHGLVDANLGGNLFKKRIASNSGGKRGGFRTLLAYKKGACVFFLYGFDKNDRSNITDAEEDALKELTKTYLLFVERDIRVAIKSGELIEVKDEKKHSKYSS